ncbi:MULTISPECIES: heparan-alpha-glucosaminide N-acetyltransferase domain-containing protein [unclassified Nocardiopsis]|uniref:heparan-alpha-glucosaminide N-acetyltransferase domain-containing protein n=1 Tax=unclassified Nocardiopsis TaxID=2649073 RepID=UPI001F208860|nr:MULTISPECIES: heparan-alpha-glucosaminide N-acetyltransferase domain-containing protein [unclassified Nocardiopsis]
MAQNQSDDTSAPVQAAPPGGARIDGIDAARALAVFGMFIVHLGVDSMGLLSPEDYAWDVHSVVRGNSSALFALLAGVSLAIMTGRTAPVSGDPLRRAAVRILARALLIGLLGLMLDLMAVPIAIILTYYAGFFVLALPLVRLRAGALWAVAGVLAVLGPPVSFLLRDAFFPPVPRTGAVTSFTEFFLTGYYPAVTFMVYVFAGMAVGRTDLTATAVRLRLLATGAALAVVGHVGPWLLLYRLGGLDRLVEASGPGLTGLPPGTFTDPAVLEEVRYAVTDEMNSISGQVPTDSWWWLAVGTPHTGTTFEMAEAVGQGLVVLVACVFLCERLRILMYPLTSVGRMPLSVYTGHVLALAVVISVTGYDWHQPWLLEQFILVSLALATLWRLVVGRGPAELVLAEAANGAVALVEERRAAVSGRSGG